eukprot:m.31028 g.31028  ORF g.31028 m.31028 type:complete len:320 (-) comp13934_c0_seq1:185-1144(-)
MTTIAAASGVANLEIVFPTPEARMEAFKERGFSPANIAAGTLYYKLSGNSNAKDKVLLIGGVGQTGDMIDAVVSSLLQDSKWKDNVEICTFDNRGTGQSSNPNERYTTSAMAVDCRDLLKHLGWSKTHIFGHSMGGMVAQEIAATFPDLVHSLTLSCTTANGAFTAPWSGVRMFLANIFGSNANEKLGRTMKLLFLEEVWRDPTSEKYQRLEKYLAGRFCKFGAGANGGGVYISQISAVTTHNISAARLEAIKTAGFPILVLKAKEDYLVKISRQEQLACSLGVEPRTLHSGHGVLFENPEQIAQFICENMSEARARST